MGRRDNLIGQKFAMLTVFDGYLGENNNMVWLSKCDCGSDKIIKTMGADLKNGKVKSCSCLKAKRLGFGESAFNKLYDTYRRRAKQKNLNFELSKDELKK